MNNDDYISKSKIIKFIENGLNKEGPDQLGHDGIVILAEIEFMETDPDVVKVVRCKNCEHCDDQGMSGLYCTHPDNRNPIICRPDDFCNEGKERHDSN